MLSFAFCCQPNRHHSLRQPIALALMLGALLVPAIAPANDNCHESSGVYTCEGDQSAGVENGHNNLGTNADDVIVEKLNQDIGPNLNSSRTAGLMFTYDSGDDLTTLTLKYLESNHKIVVNGSAQRGIAFAGPVKNGDDGKHHDTSSGGNGDAGKAGRNLDLTLNSGATIVGGSNAITTGIAVDVPGGNGGEGGGSDCCGGGHGGHGDDDHGGKGGQGGQGGAVEFGQGTYDISTSGQQSSGLFVYSKAGSGGNGGSTEFSDSPGDGGSGGVVRGRRIEQAATAAALSCRIRCGRIA